MVEGQELGHKEKFCPPRGLFASRPKSSACLDAVVERSISRRRRVVAARFQQYIFQRPLDDVLLDTAASVRVSYAPSSPLSPPVLELHLRGLRLEEAMRRLEKQIDSALIHGLREFSVVHGKGEGVLRTAIHEYLRTLAVVQDFRFSAPEEGGFGKTIVTLKG